MGATRVTIRLDLDSCLLQQAWCSSGTCAHRALSATVQVGCYGSLMLLAGDHPGRSGACLTVLLPSLGTGGQACPGLTSTFGDL